MDFCSLTIFQRVQYRDDGIVDDDDDGTWSSLLDRDEG